jgi:capsule polysaccharide export protein KpsE/RkpR
VESLRQNTVIHEIDPATEIEFLSPAPAEPRPDQPARDTLATIELLWEKRRLVYRVAIWALVLSTVVAFLIPTRYESTVSIMPPESMNGSGTMLAALATKASPELAALAGGLLGTKASTGPLFVSLFRSQSVQDRVVDRLDLQKVYWDRYKQDARKKLNGRTDVDEDRKSGVITLTVKDSSPQRAHDIAQVYVEELNRLVARVSTSSARRERIFIEQRIVTVQGDLEDAEKQFGAFASKNTTLDIKEQTKAMVESAAVLQGELIAAQSELRSLEQMYSDSNVRVRALRARVDELNRQVQSMRGSDSSLASDAAIPDQLYPAIRKLPLLGVEWADLYRRMKIQEKVYELLNEQYEMARIQEAKEIPTVNVVDPANLPEKKSFPPRLLIIALLTILSVAGAVAWIFGSKRIQSLEPDDARRQLAMRTGEGLSRIGDRIANLRFRIRPDSSKTSGEGSE